jgi:uncharacterized membrane protein
MQLIIKKKEVLRGILAFCMLFTGLIHFILPEPFVKIVPSILPYPLALVYISGFLELLGGIGLLIPKVSRVAAWGLVLLYIAVYPANLNMAVNQIHIDGIPDSPWFQAIRLPFQFVLMAWAWWYTQPDSNFSEDSIVEQQKIYK